MAVPIYNQQDILAQLDSGFHWSTAIISYSFATNAAYTYGTPQEESGFGVVSLVQQDAIRLAMSLWDDVAGIDFVEKNPGLTHIEFATTDEDVSFAKAYYPEKGTVWLAAFAEELANPTAGTYGFASILHQIGHALGLDHMGDYAGTGTFEPSGFYDSRAYSVMSYFGPDGPYFAPDDVFWPDWTDADGRIHSPQTAMISDIMAIQAIYGVETTTRLDDTVYGFNATVTGPQAAIFDFAVNDNPILTLFDSGGEDTLDLSGYDTDSDISLVAGTFSSANSMANNIGIAFTTVIENAVGGSGNDRLLGNDADNHLAGGAGDDVLTGAAGADTLEGGAGDDTYQVDDALDTIIEAADGGRDTLVSSVDAVLSANIENLTLSGLAVSGTGNDRANVLVGNAAGNILAGGLGRDTYAGGAGADHFVFAAAEDAGLGRRRDVITDFESGDIIDLSAMQPDSADGSFTLTGRRFSGEAGELIVVLVDERGQAHDRTVISGDLDGDGRADFQIGLTGLHTLTQADFAL